MEKCKFCQADLEENETVCPACGKDNAEAAAMDTETVPVQEEAPADEAVAAEEKKADAPKATPGKIALAVCAVVVLAAALIALILGGRSGGNQSPETETAAPVETVAATVPADGNPNDVTCKGSYTVSDAEAVANRQTVVAAIGDKVLTNGQLQTYYWSMVNSYLSSEYGYYVMMYGAMDYTKPLDTQISIEDESLTWQQYFLKEALNYWQLCTALAGEAKAEGVEMSQEDREYLDNLHTSLEEAAASYGMTLDELILNNIGPGGGLEEFVNFQAIYLEGKDYYQAALEDMEPTDQELEEFFALHEADYEAAGVTKEDKYVNARHILVTPKGGTTDENGATTYTDAEWAACEAEAQAILDAFLAGDKTEDSFAALATEKTEDPGSQANGGLYENMYKGQMVEPFENWCFDDSRAYGDTGLVKTSYGYHVMYYVSSSPVWTTYAKSDYVSEKSNAFLKELSEGYPMDVDYEKISLGYIALGAR